MDTLKALLNNPKARVAAGQTGKNLMEKINAHKAKLEAPKKIVKSSNSDETVELLQSLIDAKQTHKKLSSSGYEMPLIEAPKAIEAAPQDDTMAAIKKLLAEKQQVAAPKPVEVAPMAAYQLPPVSAPATPYQYPVFTAPAPIPAYQVQAPSAFEVQPAPKKAETSKQDIIKMLLTQLSKPDLEK